MALTGLVAFGALARYDRPPSPAGRWLVSLGLEERFATLEGLRVRYLRTGRGPAVLLIHGLASSIYTWKDEIPALARDHEVVALDLPGFGGSDQPADLAFDLYPRVVVGLLDQLGIARASLVGNSLGGAVASVVAAQQPARVDRLVLIDAAGFNLHGPHRPTLVRLAAHPLAESVVSHLPLRRLVVTVGLRQVFHDDAKVTEECLNEYLTGAWRPGTLASLRSLAASQYPSPAETEELLHRVEAPTLVVWGGEDTWIPLAHADRFVAAIRDARKIVLPGVGHTPQEESPEAVVRLLLQFLEV